MSTKRNDKTTVKALILTEGGKAYGFGHMTRCRALQQALLLEGVRTILVIRGDKAACGRFCRPNDRIFDWLHQSGKLVFLLRATDIVIIDSYHAPLSFYQKIAQTIPLLVSFDDYVRLPYPKGIVVSGAIGAENFPYPQKPGLQYLAGAKHILLRKEFWHLPRKKTRPVIKNVLITTGGSNQARLIKKLLSTVAPFFSKIRFHVITSNLENLPHYQNIRYHASLSARRIKALMLLCDVALSGGGQTTNELAACGVPMIGIRFAANQRFNIQGWQKCGALKYAGAFNHLGVFRRVRCLLKKMTYQVRCQMSSSGRKSVDGRGASLVAEAVANSWCAFRPALTADRRRIFKWANDPETRAVSFQTNPIGWAEHCAWFSKKLQDRNCLFFIVMWQGNPVGQVRFERTEPTAIMSISIEKAHRGKGLGASAIRLAAQKIFRETGVQKIYAYVKSSNDASQKAFMRSGFALVRKVRIREQQSYLFTMRKNDE